MKTLYLIRHGETDHNRMNNRLSGISDTKLTPSGIEQCKQLAHYFKRIPVDTVISSPLSRALDSAQLIFPTFKDDIRIHDDVIEIDYGQYEGFDRSQGIEKDAVISRWDTNPGNMSFPGGDNVADHAERVFNGLKSIASNEIGSSIAILSHRTSIRLIVAKILKIPLDHFRPIPCDNCSVTTIVSSGKGDLKLVSLNNTHIFQLDN